MTLIYLHGFASDGGGWKAAALQKHFPGATVVSPDLPADPAAVVQQLADLLRELHAPIYVFGTSLGGFYALFLSARYGLPAFLFNPSIRPDQTLVRGIGKWETFIKKRPYHFEPGYLNTLAELRTTMQPDIQPALLHLFLATDDEILDLQLVEAAFPTAASIRWYDRTGHSFTTFEKALKEIKQVGWIPLNPD